MNVHPLGHFRIRLSGDHPPGIVEFVTAVIGRDDVHQQYIFGALVQAAHLYFVRWEHSSVVSGGGGGGGGWGRWKMGRTKGTRITIKMYAI